MSDLTKCPACGRGWPSVTFKAASASNLETEADRWCDSCRAITTTREGQIAEKVDEAQATDDESLLIRQVMVTGIKSGTNIVGFRYPTHVRLDALTITDLLVTFKNGQDYLYKSVPVAVCEAWYVAPSKGGYFQQFIRNNYDFEKVK